MTALVLLCEHKISASGVMSCRWDISLSCEIMWIGSETDPWTMPSPALGWYNLRLPSIKCNNVANVVQCLEQSNTQVLTNLEFDGKKLKWLNDLDELKKSFKIVLQYKVNGHRLAVALKVSGRKWPAYSKLVGPETDGLKNELIKLLTEARQCVGIKRVKCRARIWRTKLIYWQ